MSPHIAGDIVLLFVGLVVAALTFVGANHLSRPGDDAYAIIFVWGLIFAMILFSVGLYQFPLGV